MNKNSRSLLKETCRRGGSGPPWVHHLRLVECDDGPDLPQYVDL